MQKIDLQIVIWKEGKHYIAQCLNIDISSFGSTKKQALANIAEALELYLEDMKINRVSRVEKPTIVKQSLQYA